MRSAVFMLGFLCLALAAPVEEHHEREARDASEEEDLRVLLTEMKETLATLNGNALVPAVTAEAAPQLPQDSPQMSLQPRPPIVLSPLPPVTPSVDSKPAPGPASPQINLFISTTPQQGGTASAPRPLPPVPGQEVLIGGPPASLGPFLPQAGMAVPVALPSLPAQEAPLMSALPNQDVQLQNPPQNQFMVSSLPGQVLQYPYVNPYMNPYGNPYTNPYTNPYANPYANSYANPYANLYNPYNVYRSARLPPIAITPPIIFRERGANVPA